jgi:putative protease
MNVACSRGVNLLSRYGFSRAVLARELSPEEIQDIRRNTNMELEVFVHGALRMGVCGLCLFSSFLGGKSANRGMCTQACRRFYSPEDASGGAYYFSPGDLQLIERIPDLAAAGVNSFKIEGRMKSAEYVGTVVSAYRLVLDKLDSGDAALQGAVKKALEILRNDFARAKTVYLIDGLGKQVSGWLNPHQDGGTGIPLGRLLKVKKTGACRYGLIGMGPMLPVAGDSIRLHRSDDSLRESHKILSVEDEYDSVEPYGSAKLQGLWITIPEGFETGDAVYLIQTKAMSKRYSPVIPKNIDSFKRRPGREKAPHPSIAQGSGRVVRDFGGKSVNGKQRMSETGEGFYVQVSRIEDFYVLQSERPEKVILCYNHNHLSRLLGNPKQPLPFSPDEIVLQLDPFFPQNLEAELAEDISALLSRGYRQFIVNNPGHFSFFRNSADRITLIAGAWLYVFNSWSLAFLRANGAEYFVSPLENNRQNLERTFQGSVRRSAFITIYSRPSLFRIRGNLGDIYDFGKFQGHQDEVFRLVSSPQGSLVFPEKYFSIADKIPFLREAGFSRFILDFSSGPLKKTEYKDIMKGAKKAAPLAGVSRFNWKDGFYRVEE